MKNKVNHPQFTKLYIWGQGILEAYVGDIRALQNQRAIGRTLIVGAGTGLDLHSLNPGVTEVVLLEPDPAMTRYLRKHYPDFMVVQSSAECMELASDQFDTVITSLVLCSVEDVAQTLHEVWRVLKGNGNYLFFEHVQHESTWPRRVQNLVNPLWRKVAGGCQLNRDVRSEILESPLILEEYRVVKPNLIAPMIVGRAVASRSSKQRR
ncbi:class I SAM-dependent methyltransferase [Sulfoacidibacillus thermotolerans]|uniref:Methyltransferase type 11 domain-containing protein n=1 Tax=Sulfoacidibacillus thermotolerans TaxID=1765684 RepID=A0A2U3D967_SULT2|nr:class I SAM-dependent methyltransferase [Sulfoacidibacillus thermotolerans]PWI57811.1 hypothetical protein BM613_06360 [Sulfoacidibacillus thermotolerans]